MTGSKTNPNEREGLDFSILILDSPKHSEPVNHARYTIPRPDEHLRTHTPGIGIATTRVRFLVEPWWHRRS